MDEKEQKLLQLFREIQAEFESVASKKLQAFGMEEDLTWIVGPDDSRVAKGPCADQSGCRERCKPDVCIKGICEAKHVCGYRCRLYGEPCGARCGQLCYSQPI